MIYLVTKYLSSKVGRIIAILVAIGCFSLMALLIANGKSGIGIVVLPIVGLLLN